MIKRRYLKLIAALAILTLIAYYARRVTRSTTKKVDVQTEFKKIVNPYGGLDLKYNYVSSNGFDKAVNEESYENIGESDRYYSEDEMLMMQQADLNRYVRVSGFTFCDILDGSSFDTLVPIRDLEGSLAEKNPDINTFINIIDLKAYDIFQALMRKFKLAHQVEAKRIACYTAGEGQTAAANLTFQRLLYEIDPINYFKDMIPSVVPQITVTKKRKYKLAYLIMVHEVSGFPQLSKLMELLDDGDAIVMVHVDARHQAEELFNLISKWISERKEIYSLSSIYLSKKRFSNIWGHISLVFTQLSGFWELLDLAEWDYVLNLSNYDWPLKSNAQIHESLSIPQHKNKNFIQYWADTSDLTERFYRVHIGEADFSTLYHPPELGIVTWPYTNWRAFKHHQWVILTPEAIKFLRQDVKSMTFLSFTEHTFIPDESYFATVLVNSEQFKNKIVNDNKRYLRFTGGAHPAWLGYKDRYLFPANQPIPSFYFIRKLNSMGDMFGEQNLLAWIKSKHYQQQIKTGECTVEDMSVRMECLKEFGGRVAYKNGLIIVPINKPFSAIAKNMECSFSRLGIKNVLYWALDLDIYDSLLSAGKLAILLPGLNPLPSFETRKSAMLQQALRLKPFIIKLVLDAGFDTWVLDADVLAIKDFRDLTDSSTDLFVSYDNINHIHGSEPSASTAISFYRANDRTLKVLEEIKEELALSSHLDDEEALRRILKRTDHVNIVQPDYTPNGAPTIEGGAHDMLRVRYLNPFQFMSSHIYKNTGEMRGQKRDYYLLHIVSPEKDKSYLQAHGLWLIDSDGTECLDELPDPSPSFA